MPVVPSSAEGPRRAKQDLTEEMNIIELMRQPWPWYVAGPLLGLIVPALLLLGNKSFGVSGNLRALCSIAVPRKPEYLRFDWRRAEGWNLALAVGVFVGGALAATILSGPPEVAISAATRADLAAIGIADFSGLVPVELISWGAFLSFPGMVTLLVGGFLVGFGTAYAGGCTSGHAIMGLADLQLPSLLAVIGFFAGGLLMTHLLLPWIMAVGG